MTIDSLKQLKEIHKNGKNLFWTSDVNAQLPIKLGKPGLSSFLNPETMSDVFIRAGLLRGDSPALKV